MSLIKNMLRRKIVWAAVAVLIVAGFFLLNGKKPIAVKASIINPDELRVVVNATTTSTVKSETEATLSAQRTGRVVHLPIREGDIVKANSVIARLDLTEESVQTESMLAQSKAMLEDAERTLQRVQDLFARDMVAQQELDAARRTYEIARTQREAATADAGVKRDYSVIRAPFGGVVAKKYTEVGELLLPGKQIATLVNPARIYVLASIDEVDVGRLRIDQPVKITIDAFPGEQFLGKVGRISPIVSGGKLETRTAEVWVYFDKKDPRMKPGMSADIEILITVLHQVLSVPSQAVIEREGKKNVYVAEGRDLRPEATTLARLRPVLIGETNWTYTEITKGLSAGEYVITTPEAEGLKDGAKVKIDK